MKYLLTVALLAGAFGYTLAQDGKSEKTDYADPLYTHRETTFSKDSSVAPIRISEPLFLVKYDTVTKEVTKTEFEDLTQHATKNVEYINVLKGSEALVRYGTKGRNGVVILALKDKPTDSEEFLNRKSNSGTN